MLEDWNDIYLDDEGNFREASDGDVQIVIGSAAIVQDIRHELETVQGSYPFDEAYGARLAEFIQRENNELARQELIQQVEEVVRRHAAVITDSVEVEAVSWTMREIVFAAAFSIQDDGNTENAGLTIIITVDGVRVVRSD